MSKRFVRNDRVQVYDDPLTELKPAFKADVVACVDKDVGTFEGRTLRRYQVLPLGDGNEIVEANILDAAD